MKGIKRILTIAVFFSTVLTPVQGTEDINPADADSRLPLIMRAIDNSYTLAREHVKTPTTSTSALVLASEATAADQESSTTKILENPLPNTWESFIIVDEANTTLQTIANGKRAGETPTNCTLVEGANYTSSRNFDRNYGAEYLDLVLPVFPLKKISECTYAELSGTGTGLVDSLSIRSICLPNDLPAWPEGVLDGCRNLKRITAQGPSNNVKITLYPSHHLGTLIELEALELPATVRVLADASYTKTKRDERVLPISLVSLTFPETFISIGNFAAAYCTRLTTVSLANCTALTSIGEGAFENCSALTSIDVSGCTSLTTIGDFAFRSCSNLIMFDATNTKLTAIGVAAFYDTKLACVILPTTFTAANSIGLSAFPSTLKSLIWKGSAAPSTSVFHSAAFANSSYSTAVSNGLKVTTVS